MADIGSVLDFSALEVHTSGLVWGGWFSDYLLRWLPAGLAANVLCFVAILLTLGIISRRNSFELMVDATAREPQNFRERWCCFALPCIPRW